MLHKNVILKNTNIFKVKKKEDKLGTLLKEGIESVTLQELFLDPNNPRLALKNKPGYSDSDKLFKTEIHDQIFDKIIDGKHDIIGDLVEKIISVGWEDHNQIIVYQPKEFKGQRKFLVTEGNRRVTSLNYIHTKKLPELKKKYEKAKNSSNPTEKIKTNERKYELDKVQKVVDATKKLYVKVMVADNPQKLQTDLPKLLSIIHLNGPKDWGNYERAKFVFETYLNLWNGKHKGSTIFNWDDEIERETQSYCNIKTLNETRKTIRAYQWFENFKSDYEDKLPNDTEFSNEDYFLFECITNSKWFREDVLNLNSQEMEIPEDASDAIYEWSFKKERTHLSKNNDNIFPRHQMVKELNTLREKGLNLTPPYQVTCFDIQEPEKAKPFNVIDLEFRQLETQRAPNAILSELVKKLKDIKGQELRHYGETVRKPLKEASEIISDYLKMMEATNETGN